MMVRLGILETHPIQYKVPWFRMLAETPGLDPTVFYCLLPDAAQQGAGFGKAFEWDIPLLDGYRHEVLDNCAKHPSVVEFGGCDTPGIDAVVRSGRFDAFLVNGWVVKSCLQLLWACRRHDVPCIVRGEANDLRPRAAWKRWLQSLLVRRYSAVLTIGEANRRFYQKRGIPADRLFFAPYCVDHDRFARAADELREDRQRHREGFGIGADAFCFLFSGKLEAKKRPLDLIRAAVRLHDERNTASSGLHVLVVGDGELMNECRSEAQASGLSATFTGFLNQSEIPGAYAAADALVLPSDAGETWGLVVNEAMAGGLPVIVSDQVGCAEDLVLEGRTGFSYPCGDLEALASAMQHISCSRDQAVEMGKQARAHASTYNYSTCTTGLREALEYIERRRQARSR